MLYYTTLLLFLNILLVNLKYINENTDWVIFVIMGKLFIHIFIAWFRLCWIIKIFSFILSVRFPFKYNIVLTSIHIQIRPVFTRFIVTGLQHYMATLRWLPASVISNTICQLLHTQNKLHGNSCFYYFVHSCFNMTQAFG